MANVGHTYDSVRFPVELPYEKMKDLAENWGLQSKSRHWNGFEVESFEIVGGRGYPLYRAPHGVLNLRVPFGMEPFARNIGADIPDCDDPNAPVWNYDADKVSAIREEAMESTGVHSQYVKRARHHWTVRAAHALRDSLWGFSDHAAFVVKSALGALLAWLIVLAGMAYL